ncbi:MULTISPECIES: dethiobiotin synthase [Rhizobium]|uniref:ATP-dependent dethiobiotin synthetase BioD n=1 Tax=Rhizobium favelukesii TaxID=348824 RepID=W6RRD6_9HYPH|nr:MULTISPECIES: dethiobiotin synthase [Rhizobium]MCA0804922.1 dethiobiotin synthase [Rhizobium sp. T1473]MCS0459137.1 dethiobiotin synthase [Rhizobium favelukesii]UFS79704.1 dethiobiotin synthase [Rhizobium sp. T136]CDM61398.1 ATP-dependent dethiobiotin synthetase BioD [Rhizobium favelukesii]
MMARFVVTGTDTGIGKTVFAAALTSALGACYWKPVQSGLEEETDAETVARLGNVPAERIVREAYRLKTPASPHHAAMLDDVVIDPGALSPPTTAGSLVIEGAGGVLVPLTSKTLFADVFARWQVPVIVCARTSLGTINHTLMSLEALQRRTVPVFGIAFTGEENLETQRIIVQMSGVRTLGRLAPTNPLTHERLMEAFHRGFDITMFRSLRS